MDILTGLALVGGGVLLGNMLMADYYASLKRVQDYERRKTEARMAEAEREMDALRMRLEMRTSALTRMEKRRAEEASWCDGYEAGMREGLESVRRGIRIGDVVTFTRIRNARRINSAND